MDTKQYGFFFYANKYYVYFCVIIGILLIMNQQNSKKERMSRRLLSQMVLLPFLLNVLEHFGVIRTSFDVTPLGFSLSCLLVFIAVFRYDFLNVKKKILEEIVEGIRDGIIIFDETGELSFANQEAMNLWEPKLYKNAELFYQLLKQVDGDVERLKEDGECILHMKNRYIQIQMNISKNYFGQVLGISFLLKDITRYYQLLEQTKQTALLEQRLAVEKEQSNIIQKVHDTLGHTLR